MTEYDAFEITEAHHYAQEMEAEGRIIEKEAAMYIEVKYERGEGLEQLVQNPMKPNSLIWIPF